MCIVILQHRLFQGVLVSIASMVDYGSASDLHLILAPLILSQAELQDENSSQNFFVIFKSKGIASEELMIEF
jgi:hypothetical protein